MAVIPARAGSKRIPAKNHKVLAGKPLVSWTVEAALSSNMFEDIIVATDSIEVMEICKSYNVEIVARPGWTASDDSTTATLLEYLYPFLSDYSNLCYLQPTSPLRDHLHIVEAFRILNDSNSSNLVSVTRTRLTIENLFLHKNGKIISLSHALDNEDSKSNLLYPNGAIYISKVENLKKRKFNLLSQVESVYIMPEEKSIDIDYEVDFVLASYLLSHGII